MEKLDIEQLNIYNKKNKLFASNNTLDFVDQQCLAFLITAGNKAAENLVIVNHEIADLSSSENVLMKKILEAVGLSLEKVLIISKPAININLIWRYLNISRCLMFGVNPKNLGLHIDINNYLPTNFNNKILLLSPSIEALQKHPENKKLLWKALQAVFK